MKISQTPSLESLKLGSMSRIGLRLRVLYGSDTGVRTKVSFVEMKKVQKQCHVDVDRTLELDRKRFGPLVSRKSVIFEESGHSVPRVCTH